MHAINIKTPTDSTKKTRLKKITLGLLAEFGLLS